MRSFTYAVAALAAVTSVVASSPDPWDRLAAKARVKQAAYVADIESNSTCTPKTASVRREWGSLTKKERKAYIDAVKCLASTPSKSDPSFSPGARSRYDDFVAVHINQTFFIHATGNFLTWHRYFTWAYEHALREECGYKGYQPYWAWNKYADDPLNSPMFDGSPYSMSGNGAFVPHEASEVAPGITLPPGTGGGCVNTGPFKNFKVNLGPLAPTLKVPEVVPQNGTGQNYNPRCLRRDINVAAASWTTTEHILHLFDVGKNITSFQNLLQGDFPAGYLGIHSGGHYTVGGDPGGDFFISPGDPAFWLHHAAIDRIYWTWQNQDPSKRTYVVDGPTILGVETSPKTTLQDVVDMTLGVLAPRATIEELVNTLAGPFCYVYT